MQEAPTGWGLIEEIPPATLSKPLQLGVYDRSFFAAMALGRWEIGRVNWGGNQFTERLQVVVGTESKDLRKRRLLAVTIGRYGNVHNTVKRWHVYLPNEFSFMLEPEQEVEYQLAADARGRTASYMWGLLAGMLEHSADQMKFQNEYLPANIMRGFKRNFHFDLGSLSTNTKGHSILYVHRVRKLLGMLVVKPSVYKLPFFRDLSEVWSKPQ